MKVRLDATAAAVAAAFSVYGSSALAQIAMADPVVVTATRFSETDPHIVGNVVSISRDEIAASGALSVPDVLKRVTGMQVRSLYGGLSSDVSIDMRGFGEGSAQRVLVLLNGRRLNPLDTASINWAQVPLERVERIEVINGSGAVLYGDNAVGGVINIITDSDHQGGSVSFGAGSRDTRLAGANYVGRSGAVRFSVAADHKISDGWRDNNAQEQNTLAGDVGVEWDGGEFLLELGGSTSRFGLPGSLTRAQYDDDPRQAQTSDSFAKRENAFIRPGVRHAFSENVEFAAELGLSESTNESWISSFPFHQQRDTETVSFTPRVQWDHGLGALESTTVIGFDYYDGRLSAGSADSPSGATTNTVRIKQESTAFYLQNHTAVTEALTLSAGYRNQKVDQSARDAFGLRVDNTHRESIWETGASYRLAAGLRVFARVGQTFRFANLDELTTFGGFVSQPVEPETGRFVDVGGEWSGEGYHLGITAYNLDMNDEIAFNNNTFENENLAKSRHRGINLDSRLALSRHWELDGGISYQRATFRAGADRGKSIPLVPEWSANAGVTYNAPSDWSVSAMANYVGSRHFGGDTANSQPELPSYTVVDLLLSKRIQDWTVRARALNVLDRKYSPNGFDYGTGSGFYPADGRAFFIDARLAF